MAMSDYMNRFSNGGTWSAPRQGTIVGLLSIGCLLGCLSSAAIADRIGRKWTIFSAALVYIVGVIIEITSTTHWVQFAIGRLIAGLGVGALSTAVPMYQSETVPKNIRSMVVASYQLMITIGIWLSYMVRWNLSSLCRLHAAQYNTEMLRLICRKLRFPCFQFMAAYLPPIDQLWH